MGKDTPKKNFGTPKKKKSGNPKGRKGGRKIANEVHEGKNYKYNSTNPNNETIKSVIAFKTLIFD